MSEPLRLELTSRQAKVYEFMIDFYREHGIPPSLREIGNHFGFDSPNGARAHLRLLVRKGWARQLRTHTPRGFIPITPGECPLCGAKHDAT